MPKFIVNSKLEHNGQAYSADSEIELSKKAAEALLELNVISALSGPKEFTQEQILEAMAELALENKDLFTADDVPTTKALEDILGGNITAEQRNSAWEEFTKE